MDRLDVKILTRLQRDSSQPVAEIAAAVGLSASACHRRIKLLEESGAVLGYSARLDPMALGCPLEVVVEITLSATSKAALEAFEAAVGRIDEILECSLMSGRADYLLRVAARDTEDYERIHRNRLAALPGVASMTSSFMLKRVKPWRGYPVTSG